MQEMDGEARQLLERVRGKIASEPLPVCLEIARNHLGMIVLHLLIADEMGEDTGRLVEHLADVEHGLSLLVEAARSQLEKYSEVYRESV